MNIQENVATFITKLPKVILLCVIIYLISLNFKTTNEAPKNQEVKAEVSNVVPLDAVKKYFPTCTSVEKVNEVHYAVKAGGEEIGKLLVTTRDRGRSDRLCWECAFVLGGFRGRCDFRTYPVR